MTNETNKQLSETKQALAETKQLRGTFDQVIRQINETYNASNGWAITRTSSVLVNFSVWLERSVKQGETPKWEAKDLPTLGSIVNTSETHEKSVKVETQVVKTAPKTAAKKTTEKKDV